MADMQRAEQRSRLNLTEVDAPWIGRPVNLPFQEGSVRERFAALAILIDSAVSQVAQLGERLGPVLRPGVTGEPEKLGARRANKGPGRPPQCELACRIDAAESVVHDLIQQVNALIERLEV